MLISRNCPLSYISQNTVTSHAVSVFAVSATSCLRFMSGAMNPTSTGGLMRKHTQMIHPLSFTIYPFYLPHSLFIYPTRQ